MLEPSVVMPPYLMNHEIRPGKDLIHYSGPVWDQREIGAAVQCLYSGKWLPSGGEVYKFENAFSRKFGHNASLMVNSGSSANLTMLASLKKYYDWRDGDEIIVSVVGFPTTVAPIIQNNLKPVFVDIELTTLNFDLDLVREKITPKTKAIFISPVLGNPPDMERLHDDYRRLLVLDGCDSLGSKFLGTYLSAYALATSCSFYPAHHLCTGEGGMVSSSNEELVRLTRKFAWWGRDCWCVGAANSLKDGTCGNRFSEHLGVDIGVVDHKYIFSEIGYNLKPLDLQGAIGLEQLKKFDMIHEKRREIYSRIRWFLAKNRPDLFIPTELSHAETSWFGIPILCPNQETKTKLVKNLEDKKIQTRNYFAGNLLCHPGYKHLDDWKKYPVANEVLSRVFFIGCYPLYSESVLQYIESAFIT